MQVPIGSEKLPHLIYSLSLGDKLHMTKKEKRQQNRKDSKGNKKLIFLPYIISFLFCVIISMIISEIVGSFINLEYAILFPTTIFVTILLLYTRIYDYITIGYFYNDETMKERYISAVKLINDYPKIKTLVDMYNNSTSESEKNLLESYYNIYVNTLNGNDLQELLRLDEKLKSKMSEQQAKSFFDLD